MNNTQNNTIKKRAPMVIVAVALWIVTIKFLKMCIKGLKGINLLNPKLYLGLFMWLALTGLCVVKNFAHLRFIDGVMALLRIDTSFYTLSKLGMHFNYVVFFLSWPVLYLFIRGIGSLIKARKYQQAINVLGIENAKKQIPQVVNVIRLGADQRIVQIKSPGMGPGEWKKLKDNLSFEIQETIDEIKVSKDKTLVQIHVSSNDLQRFIKIDKEKIS